ncbi:hypothetical protein [Luteimonas arsenica]|uniref:hypothetical protein n=1 Tax=Luteimonas arsenica TaxID=1586242 RepID=UPI001055A0CC|nr:hypothetical protein [Luteimonas arsenica]
MHWKIKAAIQNAIAVLPASVSYPAQFWLQRRFGGLRAMNPVDRLSAGIETWKRIQALGQDPSGKVFFEVGTGRVPVVPLAYWLLGADRTVTIDLNPYLRADLVEESIGYIRDHAGEIRGLFGPLLREERMAALLEFADGGFSLERFLSLCRIEYIAPGDAAHTGLPDGSIHFHTSYTVLEHIPEPVLESIMVEGERVLADNGLFIHRIDYSDHFWHSDERISAINFLQFSDRRWQRFAGNRYMYVNRLRHDDYLRLFESTGQRIVMDEPKVDPKSQQLLQEGGIRLDARFSAKPLDILAIKGAWIASRKAA